MAKQKKKYGQSCPELDIHDWNRYPCVDDEEFFVMQSEYLYDTSHRLAFPFIRTEDSEIRYVEVYVWDSNLYPDSYERFIIKEGYRMDPRNESIFIGYTDHRLYVDPHLMKTFSEGIMKTFPEWGYCVYEANQVGLAMEHLYYASHASGAKGILYKSGLSNIAHYLDLVPEINADATTPESIFGKDIPIELLRILNKREFIHYLFETDISIFCLRTYMAYREYIDSCDISYGQWRYLEELRFENGMMHTQEFNKELFDALNRWNSDHCLSVYCEYMDLWSELVGGEKMIVPKPWEVRFARDELIRMKALRTENEDLDQLVAKKKDNTNYEFSADGFSVTMPARFSEVCIEAAVLNNGITEWMKDFRDPENYVLFIRRTDSPKIPLYTLRIQNGKITDVLGKYDLCPAADAFVFLAKYAEHMWVSYDPKEIVKNHESNDEEVEGTYRCSDEVVEFIEGYTPHVFYDNGSTQISMDITHDSID